MEPKRKIILITILLILAIGNYTRIIGSGNVRTVEFLSIFAIGALTSLLICVVIASSTKK